MTYETECTGTPVIDINRQVNPDRGKRYIIKQIADALQIVPTSRCLDFIQFFNIKRLADVNMIVEIRENDPNTNLPKGDPGSSNGLLGKVNVPYSQIPLTPGNVSITIGLVLPTSNIRYWVVVYSSDFNCVLTTSEFRYEFSLSDVVTEYMSSYFGPETTPCSWNGPYPGGSWALATYKKTYSPPPPPPVGTLHFSVTSSGLPLEGASISVDGTNRGVTNALGILDVPNLTIGVSHTYTASKSGYNSVSSSVILDSTPKTVPVPMTTTGGGGGNTGAVIGLIAVAGVAAAILYFATRRQE